jgi:hypothetical protein
MISRRATSFDVSGICAFGRAKHAESNYSAPFNSVWFRKVLTGALKDPDQCVFVALKDGEVCGLLIGCRMPMLFSPQYCATDQVFVADAGGDQLLDRFMDWCQKNRVVRIDMGNSQRDRQGLDRLMARRGMQRAGGMYFQNIEAPAAVQRGVP